MARKNKRYQAPELRHEVSPAAARAMRIRQSGASGPMADRRTNRVRTRPEQERDHIARSTRGE